MAEHAGAFGKIVLLLLVTVIVLIINIYRQQITLPYYDRIMSDRKCYLQTGIKPKPVNPSFDIQVLAVNETWLPRCDHGEFFSTEPIGDESIPYSNVFHDLDDSCDQLFPKTRRAFYHIYELYSLGFDWYFKENGYQSGGAGYILSRAALKRFVDKAYSNETNCPFDINEDVGISRCLANIGILPTDTRNTNGQHRFNPPNITTMFNLETNDVVYTKWPWNRKYEAFASDLITLHHVAPDRMREYDIIRYRTGLNFRNN